MNPNPPPARDLAGATVVVTRPAATSTALLRRIRALGGMPLSLPGLALYARAAPELAAADAGDAFDGWVFVSPAAVRFAFRAAPALRIPAHALVCTVGAGTQRALARHGVASVAPQTRADSEGLLALADLGDVRGRRFALVGAPGGRNLIAPALRQRGATVAAIHVYERGVPRWMRRTLDALERAPVPLVTLVSSGEALENLVQHLPPASLQRLRDHRLVVASARLAALAGAHGFHRVHVAASALPADLLRAAGEALRSHDS